MFNKKTKIIFIVILFSCFLVFLIFYNSRQPQVLSDTASNPQPELKIYFFDVGQGDSELIRTAKGDDILVDGGPDNSVLEKLGKYLPLTDNDLELVILTHPHADHVTGLVEVLKRYRVEKVMMTGASHTAGDYIEFLNLIKEKNIPVEIVDGQKQIALDASTTIEILWPLENIEGRRFDNLNNSSIVFRLSYVSSTALFMGDFEQEEKLASSSPELVKADLLKVGHHGSSNGNSQEFLAVVQPQYAVIEVGADNSYGLPSFRAIYYLEEMGVKIFRTDRNGDIVFESNGVKWQLIK
ncbi:MAG: MBL fold metallo-hydrolase [Patescibacteria group bacterium]